jgi:hypothetical protein
MLDVLKILGRRAVLASHAIGLAVLATSALAQTAPAAEAPMAAANRNASNCLDLAKANENSNAKSIAVHQCMRQWIAESKSQPPPLATNRVPNT